MEDASHIAFEATSGGSFSKPMTKVQDAAENDHYHLYQTITLLELKVKLLGDFIHQKFGFDVEQLLKMNMNPLFNYDHTTAAATGLPINKQEIFNGLVSQSDFAHYINPLSSNNNITTSNTTTNITTNNFYSPPYIPSSTHANTFYETPPMNSNNANVGVVEPYNLNNNQSNKVMNSSYNLMRNTNNPGKIKTIVTFNNSKTNASSSSQMVKKRKLDDDVESNCNILPASTSSENQQEGNTEEEMMHFIDKNKINHENNVEEPDANINEELPHQEMSEDQNLEFITVDTPIKVEIELVEENTPAENENNNDNIDISSSENGNEQDTLSETTNTTASTAESSNQNSINQQDEFLSPEVTQEDSESQCYSDPTSYTNPFVKHVTTKDGQVIQIIHESDPDVDIKYDPFNAFQFTGGDENERDNETTNDNDNFNDVEENSEQNNSTENDTQLQQQQVLSQNNNMEEEEHANSHFQGQVEMDGINASTTQQQQQQNSGDEHVHVQQEVVNPKYEVDENNLEVEESAPELDVEEPQTVKSFKQQRQKRGQEQQEQILHKFIQQERTNNRRRGPLPKIPRENVQIHKPLTTPNMSPYEKLVRSLMPTHAAFQTFFDFLWILNMKAYQPDKIPFLLFIKRDDFRSWFEYLPNKTDLASSTYRCRICWKHHKDPTVQRALLESDEGLVRDTILENRSCINYHGKQKSHCKIVLELEDNSHPDAELITLEPNLKKQLLDLLKESDGPATRLRIP